MKTTKFTILIIVFSVVSLINSNLRAGTLDVDSVYNALKGPWYKVRTVNGFTGKLDTIYDSDSTVITRIGVTDSITWNEYQNGKLKYSYRYLISYSKSVISQSYYWMLKGEMQGFILYFQTDGFGYSRDAFDGESAGYSRTKLSSDIIDTNSPKERLVVVQDQINNVISICGISKILSADIYDFNGKCQQDIANVISGQLIDISNLITGVYIISVDTGHGIQKTRIIKK